MPEPTQRRLVLLRHASAEGRLSGMDDGDRRLSAQGRGELVITARHLQRLGIAPERVIVSGARRALETLDKLSMLFEVETRPIVEEALYLAPPATVLSLIQQLGSDARDLVVIGHNPGLTSLARSLAGPDPDPSALAGLSQGLAPGAFAYFETALEDWSDLRPGGGRLVACAAP